MEIVFVMGCDGDFNAVYADGALKDSGGSDYLDYEPMSKMAQILGHNINELIVLTEQQYSANLNGADYPNDLEEVRSWL